MVIYYDLSLIYCNLWQFYAEFITFYWPVHYKLIHLFNHEYDLPVYLLPFITVSLGHLLPFITLYVLPFITNHLNGKKWIMGHLSLFIT